MEVFKRAKIEKSELTSEMIMNVDTNRNLCHYHHYNKTAVEVEARGC